MTSGARRLPSGGTIDRGRRLRFRFAGRELLGHPGDSLASALLANGVHLVARSFKYHRPRGIFTAGVEEPNALVQLERPDGRSDPNSPATRIRLFDGLVAEPQNCWPSVRFDVGAGNDLLSPLFPAGFYYKTFMWPPALWKRLYEPRIRAAAGLGRAPTQPDPDAYAHRFDHCDLLIIGAGVAGLAAAQAAVRSGVRVILAEEEDRPGGWLTDVGEERICIDGAPALSWVSDLRAELEAASNCRLLLRTSAFGCYDHNLVGLLENCGDDGPAPPSGRPRYRLWKVRAREVVIATGMIERPLVFPDNDRPGIMLAEAAGSYLHRFAVLAGGEILLFTNHDGVYPLAAELAEAGATVRIADVRREIGEAALKIARARDIPVEPATVVVGTSGRRGIRQAHLLPRGAADRLPRPVSCDLLLVSGGYNPNLALFAQARGRLLWNEELASFVPGEAHWPMTCAGGAAGTRSVADALRSGSEAAKRAAERCGGRAVPAALPPVEETVLTGIEPMFEVPFSKRGDLARAFVDLQHDVTARDLQLALHEGLLSVEHVKRYTTTGMGVDQGKTGNVNAVGILAEARRQTPPEVGVTTFRQPWTPVPFGAIVGPHRGDLFEPVRRTPIHDWAERHGAVFEDVGQWKRARYFPEKGEGMDSAVQREARTVRSRCGMLDASTLGKIDIQGPDAALFLERIYTNAWRKLRIGGCRYGIMLGEDGMVFDDGVTARLAENHFHITTTTGGAARVLAWLENWLQTEWPELRVFCTSVTEQWATLSIAGPQARRVLERVVEDIDLDSAAFPHMTVRSGRVAGVEARIFRISFTGELSFEVNVPAGYGLHVWEALMEAGRPYGLVPYGTETMHLLRAEKGYIIVGQDTDGTVTPFDLGMDWIVSSKKGDFIGRRSLMRSDMRRPDRKQLVGLLTREPMVVLEEGAQIVADPAEPPPMKMLGHVTSSYRSPNLGRSIALALVAGGRRRIGERLWVPRLDGTAIEVEVVAPVFFDPEGARLHA